MVEKVLRFFFDYAMIAANSAIWRDESCLFQAVLHRFQLLFRQDDYYPESVSLPNLHQRNAAMYKVKVGGMKSVENDSSDDNSIRPYMVCSYMAYLRPLLRYRV